MRLVPTCGSIGSAMQLFWNVSESWSNVSCKAGCPREANHQHTGNRLSWRALNTHVFLQRGTETRDAHSTVKIHRGQVFHHVGLFPRWDGRVSWGHKAELEKWNAWLKIEFTWSLLLWNDQNTTKGHSSMAKSHWIQCAGCVCLFSAAFWKSVMSMPVRIDCLKKKKKSYRQHRVCCRPQLTFRHSLVDLPMSQVTPSGPTYLTHTYTECIHS